MTGSPAVDSVGYYETFLEMYLPNMNHRELTDELFAQKIAHVKYIQFEIQQAQSRVIHELEK